MTPHVLNLVLAQLRAIRVDLSGIKGRLRNVERNLANLGQQVGALTTSVYCDTSELAGLRQRVERIERRLELSESLGLTPKADADPRERANPPRVLTTTRPVMEARRWLPMTLPS